MWGRVTDDQGMNGGSRMEYTRLGCTGLRVSRIGRGAWQFSQSWGVTDFGLAKSIVARALERGAICSIPR